MSIADNLKNIKQELPENVQLVAISKTKPNEAILEAYEAGQIVFGENRVQELTQKYEELPKDIKWHMVGHLQSNKVKYIAPFVHLIHGVDKAKLIKEIDKQAKKHNRVIDVLLQFHIAEEETKFGFNYEEAEEMLRNPKFKEYENVRICGVMGMATFTDDEEQIRKEFKQLAQFFQQLKSNYFKDSGHFKEISMGMTNDYKIAIEEGATLVRIGSLIFGKRNNH
ncbi:MAG: YggS family pyridoxal phosphate-dependent enzyme [Bacteroidota bacterium]